MTKPMIYYGVPLEFADCPDAREAVFLISVLDEYDKLGRMIPYDAALAYHKTIIGFPVVARLVTDFSGRPIDFGGHEARMVKGATGRPEMRFGTTPVGSVMDAWIERRALEGYEGEKNVILIRAKLWTSRFPEYFKVLGRLWAEGNVSTSWELTVERAEETVRGKILRAFRFIGNAILGTNHSGAVKGAGMLEFAEDEERQLAAALRKDFRQEDNKMEDRKTDLPGAAQETQQEKPPAAQTNSEPEKPDETEETKPADAEALQKEISSLKAELCMKNNTIITANDTILALKNQIAALLPYKEKLEAAETKQKKAELCAYAQARGISAEELESTEIKPLIDTLDWAGIKAIIADRATVQIAAAKPIETAQATQDPKANLTADEPADYRALVRAYLAGK